jgi:outer membrane protein assembly factor BamB
MTRPHLFATLALLAASPLLLRGFSREGAFWSQWGRNPQHTGMVDIPAQPLNHKLADILYDKFVEQEKTETGGGLAGHYQATLIDGDRFYMVRKDGAKYPLCHPRFAWFNGADCGPNAWNRLQWNVVRYDWKNGQAVPAWKFHTDWKPEPNATDFRFNFVGLFSEEPVFHPALANGYLYVPGAAGTVWKVDLRNGKAVSHVQPFGKPMDASNTFVSGPLAPDDQGEIYYNVIQLNIIDGNPWNENDAQGAWLVKVTPNDQASTVTYKTLVPNAPPPNSTKCPGTFLLLNDGGASLPWPPGVHAVPPTQLCGLQRPSVNVAPAIAPDGTIYTVSVAHFDNMVAYVVAVNPDLTPKWASTLQNRLTDGCGEILPIAKSGVTNEPNSCRHGTTPGVDPTTNATGSATVTDFASSTPTILPDGSVIFAATDNYNFSRGHLFHFDADGNYLNAYTFGWDSTAGVYTHDNTFSIVIKDNHYPVPAYCSFQNPVCTAEPPGPYFVTQLDPNLDVEWSFQNTTIDKNHPNGYEWCVNAPVIDSKGLVYVTSEDGHVYSLPQGHKGIFKKPHQKIFLKEALGAAYTPLSIGQDGKVYSQNDGHLFVVGR